MDSLLFPGVIGVVRLSEHEVLNDDVCMATVNLVIIGIKQGDYAVRIHQYGDRRAPDASSLGAAFGQKFGRNESAVVDIHENGVLGMLTANEFGVLKGKWKVTGLELASVVGRSVIIEQRVKDEGDVEMTRNPSCVLGIANPEVVAHESR